MAKKQKLTIEERLALITLADGSKLHTSEPDLMTDEDIEYVKGAGKMSVNSGDLIKDSHYE